MNTFTREENTNDVSDVAVMHATDVTTPKLLRAIFTLRWSRSAAKAECINGGDDCVIVLQK